MSKFKGKSIFNTIIFSFLFFVLLNRMNITEGNESNKINLREPVKIYMNAYDAQSGANSLGTWRAGEYHVYNRFNNMINITRVKGSPGAWINPKTSAVESSSSSNTKVSTNNTNSDRVKVSDTVRVYTNAYDAKLLSRSVGTWRAGEYYVFNRFNGMINITRTKGSPGAWINPISGVVENIGSSSTETPKAQAPKVDTNSDRVRVSDTVRIYTNAYNAKSLTSSVGTWRAGDYYVFNRFNGMINITRTKGTAGAWINPISGVVENIGGSGTETPKDQEPKTQSPKVDPNSDRVRVSDTVRIYTNAYDAKSLSRSVGTWRAGDYYVFNRFNGMINITRIKGTAGAWINPISGVVESIGNTKEAPKAKSTKTQKEKTEESNTAEQKPESNKSESIKAVEQCLAEASDYKDEFVCEIAKHAVELANSHDLYASVMIAQAAIESGYGKSGLSAAPNYNLFGIKGQYKGQSVEFRTFEYTPNGTRYEIKAHFKKYPSYRESLEDYVELLTGYGVEGSWLYNFYYGARRSQTSSYKDATAHLTGRYATSPYYASSLNEFIEEYNLTRFD